MIKQVVTTLSKLLDIKPDGFVCVELAPEVTFDQLAAKTGAPVRMNA